LPEPQEQIKHDIKDEREPKPHGLGNLFDHALVDEWDGDNVPIDPNAKLENDPEPNETPILHRVEPIIVERKTLSWAIGPIVQSPDQEDVEEYDDAARSTSKVIPGNKDAWARKSARFCTQVSNSGLKGLLKFLRYQRKVAIIMLMAPLEAKATTI
ncbi:9958_t:CDS:2, partial [Acaulospora colombiana]